jgi:hypothetical protein
MWVHDPAKQTEPRSAIQGARITWPVVRLHWGVQMPGINRRSPQRVANGNAHGGAGTTAASAVPGGRPNGTEAKVR